MSDANPSAADPTPFERARRLSAVPESGWCASCEARPVEARAIGGLARAPLGGTAWVLYLLRSKRVAATFVR